MKKIIKDEVISVGRYRVVKKERRKQGEWKKNKKSALCVRTVSSLLFWIIMMVFVLVATVGGVMSNQITYTRPFAPSSRAETEQKKEYKSMAVLESSSMRILSGYNETQKLPMASTTKIMTAIIAIENFPDLNEEKEVPTSAVGVEGTSMYLRAGEKLTILEYLYGLMLPSANDSAVALGILIAGSEEKFAEMMNMKARNLGLNNTNFVTASGLHHDDHYTTAEDLAKLTAYAMKNENFRKIVGSETKTIRGSKIEEPRHLKNKQKLMWDENLKAQGIKVTGVKSGFTPEAGRCLVTSAEKNGMEIIVVVLNAPDMFVSTSQVIEEVFSDYSLLEILAPKKHITSLPVSNSETKVVNLYTGEGFYYPLTNEERVALKITYDYPSSLEAPITKNQIVGELKITLFGETLFTTPILTIEEVHEELFSETIKKILMNF